MSSIFLLIAGHVMSLTVAPVTIEGIARLINPHWEVRKTANGRAALRCSLLLEDGSYRPQPDDEIIIRVDGEIVFGGHITEPDEEGLSDLAFPMIISIQANDYNALAARRHVTETIPAGSLKAALLIIVGYLPGITLDPAQVDGPALPDLVWSDVKAEDVLNELSTRTDGAFQWQVTTLKFLRMFEPSTEPAPFNISPTTDTIHKLRVERTRQGYANRVIVRTDSARVVAEDPSALSNPWELLVTAPDSTPDDSLQTLADSILALHLPELKRFLYESPIERGLLPGQTQVINRPERNVNNTFLLTEVVIRGGRGDMVEWTVTAVEGLVQRTGWRDTYKRWNGGGSTMLAGGSGGTSHARFAYFLGGNGVDATRSPTASWVPASGGGVIGQGAIQVQINTVPRGTTAALITGRLRALQSGVSVRARLFDVTDNIPCPGMSVVVTSTAWETVSFSVTLTPGSHLYELQLLPGVANADVLGCCHLE